MPGALLEVECANATHGTGLADLTEFAFTQGEMDARATGRISLAFGARFPIAGAGALK
jgi:hypothetical protein